MLSTRRVVWRRLGAALACWYMLSSAFAYPDYLAYFSELAGGSRAGWRYLGSSNLDWGQDLPALAAWQRENGDPDTQVLYHGTAPLAAYGVRSTTLGQLPFPPYLAVTATSLYLYESFPLLQFLRAQCEPVARLAHTIFIYDTGPDVLERMLTWAQEDGKQPARVAPGVTKDPADP